MICTNPGDPLGSNRGNVLLVAVLRTRFPGLLSGEGDAEARSVLESFVTSAKQTQGKRRDERPRLILRTFCHPYLFQTSSCKVSSWRRAS